MISFGRITIRVLIFLLWKSLSSSISSITTQCSAAFVVATDEVADTAEGESIAPDAVASSSVETTAAATTASTDETKKERVLSKTWTLFHSVDSTGQANDTSFTPRAKVTLVVHMNDDGNNNNAKTSTLPPVLTIENHVDCLSQESVHRMMETEWYQLKLVEDEDNGNSNAIPPPPVLATVPACRMRLANFRDELVLTFGTNGHVISLASMPLVSPLAPPNCDDESLLPKLMTISDDGSSSSDYIKLESRISFETAIPGMMLRSVLPSNQPPPGLKYLSTKSSSSGGSAAGAAATDKPPPGVFGQDSKQQQAPPDNTMFGFLSRYWYILAPIILLNLFSPEPAPPATEQGAAPAAAASPQRQRDGGAPAVQKAVSAPAPAAPQGDGGGDVRQRRGKRG